MTASITDYTALVPNMNTGATNFNLAVQALVAGFVDANNVTSSLVAGFDLDTSVGVQLDAAGAWAGITRYLNTPLPDTYFAFDTFGVGWDQGTFYQTGDPVGGTTVLDDAAFRTLIRSKIGANQWDGTMPSLTSIMRQVFTDALTKVFAVDNQDMSMTVAVAGKLPSVLQIALLRGGYLVPKPAAVKVNYITTSLDNVALFGFDVNNAQVAGWDTGAWGIQT